MRRIALFLLFTFMCSGPLPARAMDIDVSSKTIQITTGFTGAQVAVFGTKEADGALAIVIEGPRRTMTVRKKGRLLGVWTNTSSTQFADMPSYYDIAADAPLNALAAPDILADLDLGVQNLIDAAQAGPFADALQRIQKKNHLYAENGVQIERSGISLFKAVFTLPALVSPGTYHVKAYLFTDGHVAESDSPSFNVVPVGLSAELHGFARDHSFLYGVCGVIMALGAGWLATVLLKRG